MLSKTPGGEGITGFPGRVFSFLSGEDLVFNPTLS